MKKKKKDKAARRKEMQAGRHCSPQWNTHWNVGSSSSSSTMHASLQTLHLYCTCTSTHTGHLPALLFLYYSHDKIFFCSLPTTTTIDLIYYCSDCPLEKVFPLIACPLYSTLRMTWFGKKSELFILYFILSEWASLWFFACRPFSFSFSLARVLIRIRGRVCLQLFPILSRSFFSFQELQKHKSLFLQLLLLSALIIHRVPGFTVSRSLWQI